LVLKQSYYQHTETLSDPFLLTRKVSFERGLLNHNIVDLLLMMWYLEYPLNIITTKS